MTDRYRDQNGWLVPVLGSNQVEQVWCLFQPCGDKMFKVNDREKAVDSRWALNVKLVVLL